MMTGEVTATWVLRSHADEVAAVTAPAELDVWWTPLGGGRCRILDGQHGPTLLEIATDVPGPYWLERRRNR